jgi:glutamine amidotransferase
LKRKPVLAVVNYGVGNLRSIRKAAEKAGGRGLVTDKPDDIAKADALILPGVGAFDSAMSLLSSNLSVVRELAERRVPILGICLGMQVLFSESEEGKSQGLDIIHGMVVRFKGELKVPHMGWNTLKIRSSHPLLDGVQTGSYAYFVHSYYPQPKVGGVVIAATDYGVEFPSAVAQGLVHGLLFHPEKSGRLGLRVLENFVRMVREAT